MAEACRELVVLESVANLWLLPFSPYVSANNNLRGKLPEEVSGLKHLTQVDLAMNPSLEVGFIPQGSNLETLKLGQTSVKLETIPIDFLARRPNLRVVDLASAGLRGSLDTFLAESTGLTYLDLSDNKFTGTLSALEEAQLTDLEVLNLSENKLSGSLDEMVVENLTGLKELSLAKNDFEGDLPWLSIAQSLTSLEKLVVNGNSFSGGLPALIGLMVNLEVLDLSCNEFIGALPLELANLPNLLTVKLEGNMFEGDLTMFPLGSFSGLEELHLNSNLFTGDVNDLFCSELGEALIPNLRADCDDEVQCSCCRCGLVPACAIS